VPSALDAEDEPGRVETSEGSIGACLGLAGVVGIFAFGGELVAGTRIVEAMGETIAGEIGEGMTVIPYLAVGPAATFLIASFVALRVDVGVEVSLKHHRFLVDEQPVLDMGIVRGFAGGSFVFSTP
jgi:hypothetical protein